MKLLSLSYFCACRGANGVLVAFKGVLGGVDVGFVVKQAGLCMVELTNRCHHEQMFTDVHSVQSYL